MTEIINYSESSIIEAPQFHSARGASIDAVINAWLDAKEGLTGSVKTRQAYQLTINHFRALLRASGLDLIFPSTESLDFVQTIADAAQIYQTWRAPGSHHTGEISQNTKAHRMRVLSSFYRYASKRGHIKESNPIERLDSPKVQAYAGAEAIEAEELKQRLAAIPDTLEGTQARAILAVLLYTSRRASEVMHLTRKDVRMSGKKIHLNFPEAKGGKHFRDELDGSISLLLAKWLHAFYGPNFWLMPSDTPLWVQLYHEADRGAALGYQGIRGIVKRYLGVSKVHATRHSAALLLVLAGATEKEIQERLGHSNIATTHLYLPHIKASENKHGAKVAELLGFRQPAK